MTSSQLVLKLTEYYKGQYSIERISQLNRFCENVGEKYRDILYDGITEERSANTAITVADIKEACSRIGISYRASFYVADEKVTCDQCGETFKYSPAPTEAQEAQFGIHNRCPTCGFQYAWTLQAEQQRSYGMITPWYERYKDLFSNQAYCRLDGKPGHWYDKNKNDAAEVRHAKEMLAAKIESIRATIHVETKGVTQWEKL